MPVVKLPIPNRTKEHNKRNEISIGLWIRLIMEDQARSRWL